MKTRKTNFLLASSLILFVGLFFSSCLEDQCSEERLFIEHIPVFLKAEEFRVQPVFAEVRAMINTGKFYYYNDHIFINERYEGIHIIDNSDRENPVQSGFIELPGNLDIAIRNDMLYADNYTDLLTIDISNLSQPTLICRQENVFENYWEDEHLGYLVRYEPTQRTMSLDCSDPNFGDDIFIRNELVFIDVAFDGANGTPNVESGGSGTGGSMARFTLVNDWLYVLTHQDLKAMMLSANDCPEQSASTYVSWGIETLFPYKEYLFIGANNGMYIYDASNPATPEYVSEFRHAQACDPVFVKDDVAYVTLRDGTLCQNFINQLDVIDISDIRQPELIKSYDMDHPHGLSVRDDHLYLCEGDHGLKVFDIKELTEIDKNRVEHIKDIHAFDAISLSSDHLLIIGEAGLFQYDSSDPSNLKELSHISIQN